MIQRLKTVLITVFVLLAFHGAEAKLTLREIRTASNEALVLFFTGDTLDVKEASIDDASKWLISGKPAKAVFRYATQADPCDHHIYLETERLKDGKKYRLNTPYCDTSFT
ncbi:hypothetical protein JW906_15005, partial [bacterium]|nr:hypothetical protein [bacterium]